MRVGVSGPVIAAILVGALLAQAGTWYAAQKSGDEKVQEARDAWQRRQDRELAHGLQVLNASWNATLGQLTLLVNNTGDVVLNASQVDVLLDGVVGDANVTSRTVGGASTSVWAPWKTLTIVLTAAAKPADAAVVSPYGRAAFWRGV